MSVARITRDDFGNAARSYVVLGVIGLFTALVALIFLAEYDLFADAVRTLWDVSALIAFLFPIMLASLSYLSIAGDRATGTIKYVMGLPNSRLQYFLGKFWSRFAVAATAVVVSLAVGYVIALATYDGAVVLWRFAAFGGVSLAFTFSMVAIFVAISASTASRSRAMLGVFGVYFLLVPFWFGFLPFINLTTVLDALETVPGVTLSETARSYVAVLSPSTAYLESTEVAYQGVLDSYEQFRAFETGDELYGQTWFVVGVQLAWGVGALAVGYAKFAASELG